VEQLHLRQRVHEHLLEAAHVPRGLEEVAVQHHDGPVPDGAGLPDPIREHGVVEPPRIGPAVGIEIRDARGRSQGVALDLVVAPGAVAHRATANAPEVRTRLERRTHVTRRHLHDVHEGEKVVLHGDAPFSREEGFESLPGRRVDPGAHHGHRNAVRALVLQGETDALAAREGLWTRSSLFHDSGE
jgi:hypothetical protein